MEVSMSDLHLPAPPHFLQVEQGKGLLHSGGRIWISEDTEAYDVQWVELDPDSDAYRDALQRVNVTLPLPDRDVWGG
jgi:hypothetical protein